MVSSNIRPTQWRGDVSQNGTERRRRILYCLQAGRDGVSRVLSHSYNARDTHDAAAVPTLLYRQPYVRFTARGGRPRSIMAVENGPSIDSCTPGYLHVEDGWLH